MGVRCEGSMDEVEVEVLMGKSIQMDGLLGLEEKIVDRGEGGEPIPRAAHNSVSLLRYVCTATKNYVPAFCRLNRESRVRELVFGKF